MNRELLPKEAYYRPQRADRHQEEAAPREAEHQDHYGVLPRTGELMPITADQSDERPRRPVGLFVGLGALVLLLLLPFAPFVFAPVKLQVGDKVVIIRVLGADDGLIGMLPQGWSRLSEPVTPEVRDMDGGSYSASGAFQRVAYRLEDRAYYVCWFKGRRIRAADD